MNKKQGRLLIIIFVIPSIMFICFVQTIFDSYCNRDMAAFSRTPRKQINFESMWILDDIYVRDSQAAIHLFANNEKLVLYGTMSLCGRDTLMSFSESNGELIATVPSGITVPWNSGIHHIAYAPDHIYLGLDGARSTPSRVAAYEIYTNSIVWMQPLPISGGSQIGTLVADETTIGVSTTQYFLLDGSTGEVKRELDEETTRSVENPFGFYARWYAAANPQAGLSTLEFWDEHTSEIHQPPILLDDSIVLRTGDGRLLGQVRVFDRKTNILLWETASNIVSNVAVDSSHIYYLTSAAEIIVKDIRTGRFVGKIEFEPRIIVTENSYGFYIATEENIVFIYFGDGRQLFAFHFI